MEDEKDRFGEMMRLVERAREDIYFVAKDRELIEKLKVSLEKSKRREAENQPLGCLKCGGRLESYSLRGLPFDRCQGCGAVWLNEDGDCAICS